MGLIGFDQGVGSRMAKVGVGANIIPDGAIDLQHGTGVDGNSYPCIQGFFAFEDDGLVTVQDEAHLRQGHNDQLCWGHQCSETTLTGKSRFHINTPVGIEPGSLMTGSKRVDHWTSGTVYECSEIAGYPQYILGPVSMAANRSITVLYSVRQKNPPIIKNGWGFRKISSGLINGRIDHCFL